MRPQTLTATLLAALAGPALAHWLPPQDPAPAPHPTPAPDAPSEPVPYLAGVPVLSPLFATGEPAPEPTALPNLAQAFRVRAQEPAPEPAPEPTPEPTALPRLAQLFVASDAPPAPAARPGQDPDPGVPAPGAAPRPRPAPAPAPAPGATVPRVDPSVRDVLLNLGRLNLSVEDLGQVQRYAELEDRTRVQVEALRRLQERLDPRTRPDGARPVPPTPAPAVAPPSPVHPPCAGGVTVVVERGDVHIHTSPHGTNVVAPGHGPQSSTGVDDPAAPRGWMRRDGRAPVPTPPVAAPPTPPGWTGTVAPGSGVTWTVGGDTPPEAVDLWTTSAPGSGEVRWVLPTADPETGRFPGATLRLHDPAEGSGPEGSADGAHLRYFLPTTAEVLPDASSYLIWPTADGVPSPTVLRAGALDLLLEEPTLLHSYVTLDPGPAAVSGTVPSTAYLAVEPDTEADPGAPGAALRWLATVEQPAPRTDADAVLLELQALIDELGSEVTSLREELRVLHEEVRQAPRRAR